MNEKSNGIPADVAAEIPIGSVWHNVLTGDAYRVGGHAVAEAGGLVHVLYREDGNKDAPVYTASVSFFATYYRRDATNAA